LRQLTPLPDENLIVGPEQADDAAVYLFSPDEAIVFTADMIAPVCDDPHLWGRVAAANSFSDVYAMGARPFLALNLVGAPQDTMPLEMLEQVLMGGGAKAVEAGVCVAGGHSLDEPEPFYGLAVLGRVKPDAIVTLAGTQPGDALVLTKPLGVGIIITAMMAEIADAAPVEQALTAMERLNRLASEVMLRHGVHAATDVTGYGLVGHAHEMAAAAGLAFRIPLDTLPIIPGTADYAGQWCLPAGMLRNQEYYSQWSNVGELGTVKSAPVCDPQTSGGLLVALSAENAEAMVTELREAGEEAWIIGTAAEGEPGAVIFDEATAD